MDIHGHQRTNLWIETQSYQSSVVSYVHQRPHMDIGYVLGMELRSRNWNGPQGQGYEPGDTQC